MTTKVCYYPASRQTITSNSLAKIVLTWISIYLFSRDGPAASLRIYAELIQDEFMQPNYDVPSIPMGISYFPQELVNLPRRSVSLFLSPVSHSFNGTAFT